jgi:Na+-transporting NADH:ubiquinone oxidoreductase subunit NqrB
VAATVLGKYIFRINGKHIFNPSAFGIAVAVYFTGDAWISPGQWGNNMVLFFGIVCLGFIVVTRVQKLTVSLAFLGTFVFLLYSRQILYLGWPVDFFMQSVTTGSLLLFSFFMITDPKTTPNHPVARIVWAVAIALIAFYLSAFKFINGAPIWVLVCMQPLVPVLDYFFAAKKFQWKEYRDGTIELKHITQ